MHYDAAAGFCRGCIFLCKRIALLVDFLFILFYLFYSAPLRPEQPRYRELGPSSEDGLSLSVVPTCGTVFLRLSHTVDSNLSFRRALKTHLFQLAFNNKLFQFFILPFLDYVM